MDGSQTQTRRPIRQRQRYAYAVGNTYAVQTASNKVRGARIRVVRVREQLLGAMTEAEAKAEGHDALAAFRHAWAAQDGGFDPVEDVWVVEFQLVAASRTEPARTPAKVPVKG